MASKRGGLGRGLSALFGKSASNVQRQSDIIQDIFLATVQPNRYQPRKEFDPEAMEDLAESIKVYGVLQPIIVREMEDGVFELIAGERRVRAAKMAGLEKIPAIIRNYTDAQTSEIAVIENVQRQDLNPIEEARAYEMLINEFGHTKDELAAKIGRSRRYISEILRLLKLSPKVQKWVSAGALSWGQVRPLIAIENEDIQIKAAELIIVEGVSVKTVEAFIRELRTSGVIADDKSRKKSNTNDFQPSTPPPPPVTETKTLPDPFPEFDSTSAQEENFDPPSQETEVIQPVQEENFDPPSQETEVIQPAQEENFDLPSQETEVIQPVQEENFDLPSQETENVQTEENNFTATSETLDLPHENYVKLAENKLAELLGTKVKIISAGSTNQIQINFSDDAQLLNIIRNFDKNIPQTEVNFNMTTEERIAALRKFSTEGTLNN